MFNFQFCPKLQDKNCKSTITMIMTMTMTGKTRYMPPLQIALQVVETFLVNISYQKEKQKYHLQATKHITNKVIQYATHTKDMLQANQSISTYCFLKDCAPQKMPIVAIDFFNFSCMFLNPNYFSNLNYNYSNIPKYQI